MLWNETLRRSGREVKRILGLSGIAHRLSEIAQCAGTLRRISSRRQRLTTAAASGLRSGFSGGLYPGMILIVQLPFEITCTS
jgi:hypothetical protein